jgi:hypothetical protein
MANDQNAPQIDFGAAQDTSNKIHDTLITLCTSWNMPRFVSDLVAGAAAVFVFVLAFIVLIVMQTVIAIGSWLAGAFLELLSTARDENKENINDLLAETVNEMLGTNLQGSELNSGTGGAASMAENQTIGSSILGIFEEGFGGGGPVSPQQGADNARKFAGFAVNFATSQGFLSILAEAASIGFLKEFHELPDGLMRSLGLGRLQRLALQPLIQNAIQKPYQKYCMSQYRPTALAEAQIVKALHGGLISDADARTNLAELGYSDDLMDFVLSDFAQKLPLSDLVLLLNNGSITSDDVINNLTLAGMPEDQAKLQLLATDLAAAKTQQLSLLSWAESSYVAGYLDQATYNKIVSNLALSDLEEQNFRARVGYIQETPRARVSFAEVKTAVVDGIVDFSYLDTWLAAEGYDSQSNLILTFEVLQAIKTAENKVLFAKYKAAVLQKANKPVPPWITAAESTTH